MNRNTAFMPLKLQKVRACRAHQRNRTVLASKRHECRARAPVVGFMGCANRSGEFPCVTAIETKMCELWLNGKVSCQKTLQGMVSKRAKPYRTETAIRSVQSRRRLQLVMNRFNQATVVIRRCGLSCRLQKRGLIWLPGG